MSDKKDLMGYDPLEWLKEDTVIDETENEVAVEVDDAPAEEDATAEVTATPEEAVAEQPAVDVEAAVSDEHLSNEELDEVTVETSTPPSEDNSGNSSVLELNNSLQIMDVAILKPQFEESLEKLKEITLRADEDIVVDGAGMQLLLSFVRTAEQNDIKLQWEALPAPIAEAARLLNADQVLLAE